MSRAIELVAPAKINLTLEVLARRQDGYHEIASVMQTIDLCDVVRIEAADDLRMKIAGAEGAGVSTDPQKELASRAALLMVDRVKEPRGARISIEKRIPVGMGLGGGSSDAAAVLRGLNQLWELGREPASLARLAAELGSDAPFFVYCGSCLCRGRGEIVDPLADAGAASLTLFLPPETIAAKTATMYSLITAQDYSAGTATRGIVDDIAMRGELTAGLKNVFDAHASRFGEKVPVAMAACRRAGFEVHSCGSGPAFFALRPKHELPGRELALMEYLGIRVLECTFLGREASLGVRELEGGDPGDEA